MKIFKKKVLMLKKVPRGGKKQNYFYEIIEEANKMRRVMDHPNIVKLYDLLETPEQLLVLIEEVPGPWSRVGVGRSTCRSPMIGSRPHTPHCGQGGNYTMGS